MAVVVRVESAGEVGPGAFGEVGSADFPVAFGDRDAGPGVGDDVDGAADAFDRRVQAFGGWGDVAVGVVGAAGVAGFGA